jgi:hypothetical protein
MAPCKGCQERQIGCHGKCEKYAEYIKANETIKKRKMERLEAENTAIRELMRMLNTRSRK